MTKEQMQAGADFFGYDYEICGDSMTAAVWMGETFLYFVELV